MRICINPAYSSLEDFVKNIPGRFENEGDLLYDGRNTLKVYQIDGVDLVVKRFRVPNFVNQWVYTLLRPSKAERSYRFAVKLLSKGIKTPDPVAFAEEKKWGKLTHSYYICLFEKKASHIRKPMLGENVPSGFFPELAAFIANLHANNILFKDLSPGNILYYYENDKPIFSIIDINRMLFKKHLSMNERIKNFERISKDPAVIKKIAEEYSSVCKLDAPKMIKGLTDVCLKFHKV